MNKSSLWALVPIIVLLAVSCTTAATPTFTPTPSPTPTATNTPVPTSTPTPVPAPTSTLTPTPTATATETPIPPAEEELPTELFLEIIEPINESVVSGSVILVRGLTTPDAVVSIDGQTIEVDAQGEFTVEVSLQAGPNIIELVASDLTGEQKSALLSLIYLP